MPDYDGSIVIDSHIDSSGFDSDASKLFGKLQKLSGKFRLGIELDNQDILPKNMEERISKIQKLSAELGNKISLSDIPSNIDGVTNSTRQLAVQIGNLINKIIDYANAIKSGDYSDKDKHTLLLGAERAQRDLVRKEAIDPSSALSMQDLNNQNKEMETFYLTLDKVSNTLNKFKDVSISKALEPDKAQADVLGVSKEFDKLQASINNSQAYLTVLRDNLNNLKINSPNMDMSDFVDKSKFFINEMNNMSNSIEKNQMKQQALLRGAEFESLNNTAESMKKISDEASKSNSELDKLDNTSKKLSSSLKNVNNSSKQTASALKESKHSASALEKAFSSVVGRARWIILGQTIRAVINDAKQSIADLRSYNQSFDKSMQSIRDSFKNVGNSIATAFAPVLQALAPIIANVANWLVNLFNTISMFTSALFTGAKTAVVADNNFEGYSKSADKATKSTKKGTKAVKDQTKALAKFDKLDVFQDKGKNKSPDDSGGVGAGVPQAMKMFKTVDIPDNILDFKNKLYEAFDGIKEKFIILADEFSKGFTLGFKDNNLDVIQQKLQSIGQSFKEIFTDENVVAKFNETVLNLSFNLGKVVGATASVGVSLAKMLIGGFENFLSSNKERIKESIKRNLSTTIDFSNLIGRNVEFVANIAELFGEDKAQAIFGNYLSVVYNLFDTTFSNTYKIVEKVAETLADPFITNQDKIKTAVDGMLSYLQGYTSGLDSAVKGLSDAINSIVDGAISPALDSIKNIWEDRIGVILNVWNTSLKPVFEDLGKRLEKAGAKIGDFFRRVSKPIVSIFTLITDVYNKIRPFLQKYVYPMIERVLSFFTSNIGNFFQTAWGFVDTLFTNILDSIGHFSEYLGKIIDVIIDIINGDWTKAWEDAKSAFKSFIRGILSLVKLIPDMFVEAINGGIRAINNGLNAINGIGIGDFKINIPNIPQIPKPPDNFGIPGLSTGAVISPNKKFLAMLGDNTNEPEVVSPVSTMKQAFMEAIAETGMSGSNGDVVLQLDGTTFARLMNPYNRAEQNRIGISMVEGVAY